MSVLNFYNYQNSIISSIIYTLEKMWVQALLCCDWLQQTSIAFSMSYLWCDRIINHHISVLKAYSQILEGENVKSGKAKSLLYSLGKKLLPRSWILMIWLIKQSPGLNWAIPPKIQANWYFLDNWYSKLPQNTLMAYKWVLQNSENFVLYFLLYHPNTDFLI